MLRPLPRHKRTSYQYLLPALVPSAHSTNLTYTLPGLSLPCLALPLFNGSIHRLSVYPPTHPYIHAYIHPSTDPRTLLACTVPFCLTHPLFDIHLFRLLARDLENISNTPSPPLIPFSSYYEVTPHVGSAYLLQLIHGPSPSTHHPRFTLGRPWSTSPFSSPDPQILLFLSNFCTTDSGPTIFSFLLHDSGFLITSSLRP